MPLFDAKPDEAVIEISTRFVLPFIRPEMNITIDDRTHVVRSGTHWFDVSAGVHAIAISMSTTTGSSREARTRVLATAGEVCVVRYRVGWLTPDGTITIGAPLPIARARRQARR